MSWSISTTRCLNACWSTAANPDEQRFATRPRRAAPYMRPCAHIHDTAPQVAPAASMAALAAPLAMKSSLAALQRAEPHCNQLPLLCRWLPLASALKGALKSLGALPSVYSLLFSSAPNIYVQRVWVWRLTVLSA